MTQFTLIRIFGVLSSWCTFVFGGYLQHHSRYHAETCVVKLMAPSLHFFVTYSIAGLILVSLQVDTSFTELLRDLPT